MARWYSLAAALAVAIGCGAAAAQARAPSALAGHAVLPALTLLAPPPEALPGYQRSGKFSAVDQLRNDAIGSMEALSYLSHPRAPRLTGVSLPFQGQPAQGFSALAPAGDGTWWVLPDNGLGTRFNSVDFLLALHRIAIDWASGSVRVVETLWLSDPNRRLPFHLAADATSTRYLTGGDLDPESLVVAADGFWIGDEYGPYLVKFDRRGRATEFVEAQIGDRLLRSPDNFRMTMPGGPGPVAFDVQRSRGFEGLALAADGRTLWAMLEGPLWSLADNALEADQRRPFARVYAYDVVARAWTGEERRIRLEAATNALADLALLPDGDALVIERDQGEGDPAQACPAARPRPDCYNAPARFKRVWRVGFAKPAAGGYAEKQAWLDLLDIDDPAGKARIGGAGGKFVFPFLTPEGIAVADDGHVLIVNDNNLPITQGRTFGRPDDSEFILLRAPELLRGPR